MAHNILLNHQLKELEDILKSQNENYETSFFSNYDKIPDIINKNKIDLIIDDRTENQSLNPCEVCNQLNINASEPNIPLLLISHDNDNINYKINELCNFCYVDIIFKPINKTQLISFVKKMIYNHKSIIQYEKSINDQMKRLEENQYIDMEILSTMSHEFRTPLNSIIGFSELLKNITQENLSISEIHQYADFITRSGNQLLLFVNDVLEYTKVVKGKQDIQYETMIISLFLENIIFSFEKSFESKKIKIIKQYVINNDKILTDNEKIKFIFKSIFKFILDEFPEQTQIKIDYKYPKDHSKVIFHIHFNLPTDTSKDYSHIFDMFQTGIENYSSAKILNFQLELVKKYILLLGGRFSYDRTMNLFSIHLQAKN